MKIIWLPLALTDLARIESYYTEAAGQAIAHKQLRKVVKSARLLALQPYMGHSSLNDTENGVFEWNIPSTTYTLPYYVHGDEVRILRVFDQRQEKPEAWLQ